MAERKAEEGELTTPGLTEPGRTAGDAGKLVAYVMRQFAEGFASDDAVLERK
ncbi:MAG: hypothetical protein ABSD20_08625 [Terriglobales bacterium]|jgi:hypothetical protein